MNITIPKGDIDDVARLLMDQRTQGLPKKMPFVAILVRSKVKEQLRTYLKFTYSRTAKSLFPDYSGFKDHGKWKSRP